MNRVAQGTLVGSLVVAVAALGGCGSTEVDFTAGGTGGSSSGGKTATSSANTGGMTGTSSTTGTSMSGTGGATTSTTTSTSTSTSSTTTTTTTTGPGPASSSSGGGGCSADPADSACVACTKQSCCSTLVPCQSDASCVCWSGCLQQNPNNPQACFGCGNYDQTTTAFVNCASQSCLTACEGGTTTTTTGTSSSGGMACAPAAGDTACLSCAKMSCCSQVTACEGDQSCLCLLGCLTQGGSYDQCTKPAPMGCGPAPTSFLTLAACTNGLTSPCKTACQ